jgi:hypothetical protein
MQIVVIVVGGLIALAGLVWALQGAGRIAGSFMSNDPTWIWIGAGTAVAGLAVVVFGLRWGPPAKSA